MIRQSSIHSLVAIVESDSVIGVRFEHDDGAEWLYRLIEDVWHGFRHGKRTLKVGSVVAGLWIQLG